jgi:hypothetical protein
LGLDTVWCWNSGVLVWQKSKVG